VYGSVFLWAKLCLEAQSDGRSDVISVVTHGRSDDTTSSPARGTSIYLKAAKADGAISFYASEDGKVWTIVRNFNLESNDGLWVGFSAQSPDGEGASAYFTDGHYLPQKGQSLWSLCQATGLFTICRSTPASSRSQSAAAHSSRLNR